MSMVTILPISVPDPTLPVIAKADINYLSEYDPTSYDHWIFDQGGAATLVGLNHGRQLTPQSSMPAWSDNYLSMNNGIGNGLLTDLMDNADKPTYAFCAVIRDNYAGPIVKVPFGTLSASAGGSIFASGSAPARNIYETYRGVTSSDDSGAAIAINQWYFVAASVDFSGATKYVRTLVGGAAGHEASSVASYLPSSQALALGNGYFASGHASNMDFAEFIAYDTPLSLDDLASVYARSKERLAARGISVI